MFPNTLDELLQKLGGPSADSYALSLAEDQNATGLCNVCGMTMARTEDLAAKIAEHYGADDRTSEIEAALSNSGGIVQDSMNPRFCMGCSPM